MACSPAIRALLRHRHRSALTTATARRSPHPLQAGHDELRSQGPCQESGCHRAGDGNKPGMEAPVLAGQSADDGRQVNGGKRCFTACLPSHLQTAPIAPLLQLCSGSSAQAESHSQHAERQQGRQRQQGAPPPPHCCTGSPPGGRHVPRSCRISDAPAGCKPGVVPCSAPGGAQGQLMGPLVSAR